MKTASSAHSALAETDLTSSPASMARETNPGFDRSGSHDRRVVFFSALAMIATIGILGLSPALLYLWHLWTHDPLRSIGMLIVPAGILLTLRAWRMAGWELRGTWWGLLPVVAALVLNAFRQYVTWYWMAGRLGVNFLPPALSLYLYGSGVILLFAGARVWRQAWFPLALLLCAQPMPNLGSQLVDLPLQTLSAHIARSFAVLIGFSPTNPELLKLMFSPDFGMFIAPGCDGLRGAVTLGYVALITGYLKRVSLGRWLCYVAGAVSLAYLFNLIRLCALVLYYRIALGHSALENVAKQADYVIGGCLILVATILFLWVVTRTEAGKSPAGNFSTPHSRAEKQQVKYWRIATFAAVVLLFAVPGVRALQEHWESTVLAGRVGQLTPQQLDGLMPSQLGDYKLSRAWQQKLDGAIALESAAYATPGSDEITLGVWLLATQHTVHESWMIRGEEPEMRATRNFLTAKGRTVAFDTAFYSDGVTDSLVGNAFCTPASCSQLNSDEGMHAAFTSPMDFTTQGKRTIPIFFRVEALHTGTPKEAVYNALSTEAQRFLGNVDAAGLSQNFQ